MTSWLEKTDYTDPQATHIDKRLRLHSLKDVDKCTQRLQHHLHKDAVSVHHGGRCDEGEAVDPMD